VVVLSTPGLLRQRVFSLNAG